MKVSLMFPIYGNSCMRIEDSLRRHLPSDIDIISTWTRYIQTSLERPDLVIGHIGGGEWSPQWAYISPKAMICEALDEITLSLFTDKDVIFGYNLPDVEYARSRGYNAIPWAIPVDQEIFYKEDVPKKYDLMSVMPHNDWLQRTYNVTERALAHHLVLNDKVLPIEETGWVTQDYCYVRQDEDRLRRYYSESKFTVNMVSKYEYFPGRFGFGFEGSIPESAFCGCRPIVLDDPEGEYLKYWYGDFADFIRADEFEESLYRLLTNGYAPLSNDKIALAKEKFSATHAWEIFWSEVRKVL